MTTETFDFSPPQPGALDYLAGTIVHNTFYGRRVSFFITNPHDPIQNHHLRGTFFEPDELNIIARHINRGAICVDIGANIGNHALFFDRFTQASEVILFEVNPDALKILNINYQLNRPKSWDRQYLGYALANVSGTVSKRLDDANNMGSAQFRVDPAGAFRCITGDSVLASRRIDFVKIDVEGAEIDVLQGMEETIARWRPKIFAEVRDHYFVQFSAIVEKLGYVVIDRFERYKGLPNYLIAPL